MASVSAVELFTTSILSNHKVRHRHERYIAVFTSKKIDYVYHDMASDELAKKRFRRKAQDQQIPNILVHNEWRGTFEEFEEAVEFGELDLFLKIDPTQVPPQASVSTPHPSLSAGGQVEPIPSTAFLKLPPAPSVIPKMAPIGSGAGPKRNSATDFLDAIDLSKLNLTDDDIDTLIQEATSSNARAAHQASVKVAKTPSRYPGEVDKDALEVRRTYFPSETAGVKPLRLPKMGSSGGRDTSARQAVNISPSSSASLSPRSPSQARFSASQNSTRALAAEASASAAGRTFSARQVRAGLDSGKQLQDVLGEVSIRSKSSSAEGSVDSLFQDLDLGSIDMTEEEAEAFLLDGVVPEGLELGGSRIRKGKSKADKAREEQAARGVAAQARDLAADRRASAKVAKERKSLHREEDSTTPTDHKVSPPLADEATTPPSGQDAVLEIAERTKEMLDKARQKRASRMAGLPSLPAESEGSSVSTVSSVGEAEGCKPNSQPVCEAVEGAVESSFAKSIAEHPIPQNGSSKATLASSLPITEASPPSTVDDATPTQRKVDLPPVFPLVSDSPFATAPATAAGPADTVQADERKEKEEEGGKDEEDDIDLLAQLQGLSGSRGIDDVKAEVSAEPSVLPEEDAPHPLPSTPNTNTKASSIKARSREREREREPGGYVSSSPSSSTTSPSTRRAIDVQRKILYPSTMSPSSSSVLFSNHSHGHVGSDDGIPGSTASLSRSSSANSSSGLGTASSSSGGGGVGTKSPKLKARLSRIRSFGSLKRSTSSSSSSSISAPSSKATTTITTGAGTMRLEHPLPPLVASSSSAVRGDGVGIGIGNIVSPPVLDHSASSSSSPSINSPSTGVDSNSSLGISDVYAPLSASTIPPSSSSDSPPSDWQSRSRSERTLSQILRDADDALRAADDTSDDENEGGGDDDDGGGDGNGNGGDHPISIARSGSGSGSRARRSLFMPNDGLGELPAS